MTILTENTLNSKYFIRTIICVFLLCFSQFAYGLEYYSQKQLNDLQNKALALYKTKQNKEALEILTKIPKVQQTEEMLIVTANIYEDSADDNKAVNYLNQAIRMNPKSYKAYYNLGCIALKKNDYKLAAENFKLSAQINKNFAYAYYNLGFCYMQLEDYELAKKNFIKAISLLPSEKDFYYNLALAYKKLGDNKNAQKILDEYNKM